MNVDTEVIKLMSPKTQKDVRQTVCVDEEASTKHGDKGLRDVARRRRLSTHLSPPGAGAGRPSTESLQ